WQGDDAAAGHLLGREVRHAHRLLRRAVDVQLHDEEGVAMRSATITTPSDREMLIVRELDAPREQVWRAFTDPELLARWWGRGNRVTVEKFEMLRGGHWRFVEHAGGETHGFEGRVREVSPPERLSQTFEWDGMPGHVAVNTTTFEALAGGRTRIVTT